MKIKTAKMLMLVTILVIVIMSIYFARFPRFARFPESNYRSHPLRPKNLIYSVHVVKDAAFSAANSQSNYSIATIQSEKKGPSASKTFIQLAIDIYRQHGVVLFTVVNDAYFPLAASWCCNTAAMAGLHRTVLFLATDHWTGQRLSSLRPNISVVALNNPEFAGGQEYSKAGYTRLTAERTRLILLLLEAGVRLLLFEVDCLWLSNPVPALMARHTDGDIIATKVTGQTVTASGFLLLNPTTPTVKLWRRLAEMMNSLDQRLKGANDFAAVSEAENDQQFLTRLVNQKFAGVRVVYLPAELFPDGKWYRLPAEKRLTKPRPFLINNNWVIGNPAKIKRAKAFGHWFWNEDEGSCNATALYNLFH